MKNKNQPIGIIAAMDREITDLMESIEEPEITEIGTMKFLSGTLEGQPVVAVICGPGKVNAALCAQALIFHFAPRLIIKTGVAGSMSPRIGIGGIVIGRSGVQYDIDTTAVGDPLGLVSRINKVYFDCDSSSADALVSAAEALGYPVLDGCVATGDRFIANCEEKQQILAHFPAVACEMEGAAVLQTGYVHGVPVALVLSISDGANGDSVDDYAAFTLLAAAHNVSVLRRYLASLSGNP